MVYIRKVVRGGKTYLYRYKSERVGKKVRSVYLGRELVGSKRGRSVKKKPKKGVKRGEISKKRRRATRRSRVTIRGLSRKKTASYLLQFDDFLNKINTCLMKDNVKGATQVYKDALRVYNKLIDVVENEDRFRLYNKMKAIYENISSTAESLGYKVK